MEYKTLVSIIVPVYNVEKYLMRCYNSIALQTYKNWEVILIDDGSADGSGKLCDELAGNDSRIRVIHKENEGLGLTRNCGIKNSKGNYVFFVDSDDYIEQDAIKVLVELVEKHECDLAIGNFYYQEQNIELPIPTGVYSGKQIITDIVPRIIGSELGITDQLTPSSCGKLYKTSIFIDNDIWFSSERELIWEDLAFNLEYMRACRSIYLTDKPVYHYCFNAESLTHKYDHCKLEKVITMYRYMREKLEDAQLLEVVEGRLNNSFAGHIRTCLKLEAFYDRKNGYFKTIERIGRICNNQEVQIIVASIDSKYYNCSQKILSFLIKNKMRFLVYIVCKAQNMKKRIE